MPSPAANDNGLGTSRPQAAANNNSAGDTGDATAPGETVQQIGPHDGGAPGDAPPDDAGTGETTPPAAEPPTPANDDVPGQAGDAASSGETTEQTSSSNGGAPGKAPPEQPGGEGENLEKHRQGRARPPYSQGTYWAGKLEGQTRVTQRQLTPKPPPAVEPQRLTHRSQNFPNPVVSKQLRERKSGSQLEH